MSATSDFYLLQAEKCTNEADASNLPQVRDRNRRAAEAWQTMADKLIQSETNRAAAAKQKQAAADESA